MKSNTPNIVFITADQLGAAALGCYGSPVDSTPTLDTLAARGKRFDRCYATHPVCAPNRATILTGRSAVVHGVIGNNHALASDMPTYASLLRDHGYRTGGFGKFHQTPMQVPVPDDIGFLGFDEGVVSEDPKWGSWPEWVAERAPEHERTALAMCWGWPCWPSPEKAEQAAQAGREILDPVRSRGDWHLAYPSPLPAELHDTTYITELGLDFINRHLENHPDVPFLCHIFYVDPHDPYDPPEPYASMYRPDDMPDALPAEWVGKGITELEEAQRFHNFDKVFARPESVRRLRAFFHGSLKFMDDQIARVVKLLEDRGVADNTIIVFTTDHGEMLGDHGLITKGVKHYDPGEQHDLYDDPASAGKRTELLERMLRTMSRPHTIPQYKALPVVEGKKIPDPNTHDLSSGIPVYSRERSPYLER